jgi:cytochrome c oxidase subunit II
VKRKNTLLIAFGTFVTVFIFVLFIVQGWAFVAGNEGKPLTSLVPEGPFARSIQNLVNPVFGIAAIVFFLILGIVLYIGFRFRDRGDIETEDEIPEQIHGRTFLEISWTIAPALVLLIVGLLTVVTQGELNAAPPADALHVRVEGQQWWWRYLYDNNDDGTFGGAGDVIAPNELVIPTNREIALAVSSNDVIHSFWIPALNGKKDAVPGRVHPLTIEADEPGVYRGQCTEFCGLSHAYMRMRVVALSPADYEAWEENQLGGAEVPDDELAEAGMARFQSTCSACHVVEGEGGNEELREEEGIEGAELVAGAAPNLTHFASRGTFAGAIFDLWVDVDGSGEIEADEVGGEGVFNVADLEKWLRDPPAEKPMAAGQSRGMPDLDLTEEQIDALVAYLRTLE